MCASMVDIQSAMAEIRQGKKRRKKNKRQDENMYGLINKLLLWITTEPILKSTQSQLFA